MDFKTKRIPIKNEFMGRMWVEKTRQMYGDDVANKLKIIYEISFNVPVFSICADGNQTAEFCMKESDCWYLEFPEEINISVNA